MPVGRRMSPPPPTQAIEISPDPGRIILPDSSLLAAGCRLEGSLDIPTQGHDKKSRLSLAVAMPDESLRRFRCQVQSLAELNSTVRAWWKTVPNGFRRASMTVGQWWDLEYPVSLDPPTSDGYWEQAEPTFRESGWGEIPSWTIEYYCEVVLYGDPYYMVKCWSWVDLSDGGGGGGPGGGPPPQEEGDSVERKVTVTCNNYSVVRATSITCTASSNVDTIPPSLVWTFIPVSGSGLAPLSNLGSNPTQTGPLVVSGDLIATSLGSADTVPLTATPRPPFSWGTPDPVGDGLADDCHPWGSNPMA